MDRTGINVIRYMKLTSYDAVIDKIEIMDVINRYGAAIDQGDWDRLKSCFTPQSVVKLGARLLRGPDEIASYIAQACEGRAWQQHHLGSHQVFIEGNQAVATCSLYATIIPANPDEPIATTIGTYFDKLRQTEDGWKIIERELRTSHRPGKS